MPEKLSETAIRARAFWSGTITFGLVSIPVNLFPASRSQGISLRMVAEDGTPLARRYMCPKHEKQIGWAEIVRGYEIEPDEFVVVTDDELEGLEPRKSRDIDLRRFVPIDQLDPRFFERGYYLTPGSESTKAYMLLAATMAEQGRAGIATFVMREKEYLIAIISDHGILRAETMRFADEIRTVEDVGLPEKPRLDSADVAKMEAAIKRHAAAKLAPKELEDRYADRLLALVKKKERKNEDVVDAPVDEEDSDEAGTDIIDLMEVLRASLGKSGTGPRKAAKTRSRKTA
ncbi:MAG: Ku protein [Gemmatimonadota bacterium]